MLYFYVISDGLCRLRRYGCIFLLVREKVKGILSPSEIVVNVLYCLCQKVCTVLEIGDIKYFHR